LGVATLSNVACKLHITFLFTFYLQCHKFVAFTIIVTFIYFLI